MQFLTIYTNIKQPENSKIYLTYVIIKGFVYLQKPIKDFIMPISNTAEWFTHDAIRDKRKEIQQLIMQLHNEDKQNKWICGSSNDCSNALRLDILKMNSEMWVHIPGLAQNSFIVFKLRLVVSENSITWLSLEWCWFHLK